MADQTRIASDIQTAGRSRSYAHSRAKRVYDLLLATGLLTVTAPVLLLAILLNSLFTGGHPIFVQRRAGKNGVEFDLYKLRTMRLRNGGEKWSHRTMKGDDRLTSVGGLLRRIYVDELPQLVNVVIGQMSMIGPRPETLDTTREISIGQPRFRERMIVKPGVTGTAQVFFRKPESEQDLWRRYYYDRAYITRCSLKFDLRITARTIMQVLRIRGT